MPDITVTLSFTFPSADVAAKVAAIVKIYENTEVDGAGDPLWTDNQWVKELARRQLKKWLNAAVTAGENRIAEDAGSHTSEIDVT